MELVRPPSSSRSRNPVPISQTTVEKPFHGTNQYDLREYLETHDGGQTHLRREKPGLKTRPSGTEGAGLRLFLAGWLEEPTGTHRDIAMATELRLDATKGGFIAREDANDPKLVARAIASMMRSQGETVRGIDTDPDMTAIPNLADVSSKTDGVTT